MDNGSQVFYTNLLLLGFNPGSMEAKYQIKFHKDMFLKPNKKAFEVISYFLFSKLDPALCKEKFRNCWPIFDKKQEQEFRKTCCNWIKDISIEYSEARFPRIIPSIFLTPGGDKFLALYLSFSRYVLRKVLVRDFGNVYLLHSIMPSFSRDYVNTARRMLEISTNKAIQKFLRIQKVFQESHKMWHSFAKDLVSTNRLLKKKINEKRELLKKKKETFVSSLPQQFNNAQEHIDNFNELVLEKELQNQQERTEKVIKIWKNVEEFQKREEKYWEVLSSVVDNSNQHMILEGSLMEFHVPDVFLQQCKDNLLQKGVTKICKDGKVDINNVLQMWNICLKFQHDILLEAKIPDAKIWMEGLKGHIEDHCTNINILQTLSSKLNAEILPSLKASVTRLNKLLDVQTTNTAIKIQDQTFQLCPLTPELAFSPSGVSDQPAVPKRIFSLSPVLNVSDNGTLMKEQKFTRSPLLTDPLSTPKDICKKDLSFRITPIIQLEQIGKKQRTKVIWTTNNETMPDQPMATSHNSIKDSVTSDKMDANKNCKSEADIAANLQSSVESKNSDNEQSTPYNIGSSDCRSGNVSVTSVSENVKAKFAEMIVDTVIHDATGDSLTSLPGEACSDFTLDLFDHTAFITRDKLARTPPSQINEHTSETENILLTHSENNQTNVSNDQARSLSSSINEIQAIFEVVCSPKQELSQLNAVSRDSDFFQRTLLDISWKIEEEELLSKVTLPFAPSADTVNERNPQNFDTVAGASKTDTDIVVDDLLSCVNDKEHSFCDLLKQYNDLLEDQSNSKSLENESFLSLSKNHSNNNQSTSLLQ